MHDVMADFHVLYDFCDTQRSGSGHEYGWNEAEGHHHPAAHFQGAVQADDLADVLGIPLAQVCNDLVTDGVQVFLQFVQLVFVKLFHIDDSLRQ